MQKGLDDTKVYAINDWMLVVDDVLTGSFCDELIRSSQGFLSKSETVGTKINGYRTSHDRYLDKDSPYNEHLDKIVSEWLNRPADLFEDTAVINYDEGCEYKDHYDFLHDFDGETEESGDRTHTVVFYLNDDFQGGETVFPKIAKAILPKKGRMVIWKNYIQDSPNLDSMHAGVKVSSGRKWIATKWVRERKFN